MSGVSESGLKNLEKGRKPITSANARELGSKGGKASQAAHRKRKQTAELVKAVLDSSISDKNADGIRSIAPDIADDDATVRALIIAGQARSAAAGDPRSFNALMEIEREAEEKERARQEALRRLHYHLDLHEIPDTFHPLVRDVRNNGHLEYMLKGGRGSSKSTTVAMLIVELLKNNRDVHALVCRKVGNTLKASVYSKIKWAIDKQGESEYFHCTTTPMEITYKPTGQKIYFRGADDKDKIKSISPEFGYIGILWFEELDTFSGPEEIRSIEQSALRGGDKAWLFETFNPPKTVRNWANQYALEPKDNRLVHHSTYLDVPPEWLGTPFLDEAEHLKEVNPEAYEHEYGGVANGTGGAVFEYIEARTITDDEIRQFDRIYQGVDWGWYPDPYSFGRFYYDAARETIYVLDEHYVNKQSNELTAKWIIEHGYNDFRITCDSAEPKSVSDYKAAGLPAVGAIKGPGSVEYGMKWLQRRRIVIDPKRTPNAYREITQYEYERDKDGNLISGYPDADNHFIDCMRYALSTAMRGHGASA